MWRFLNTKGSAIVTGLVALWVGTKIIWLHTPDTLGQLLISAYVLVGAFVLAKSFWNE